MAEGSQKQLTEPQNHVFITVARCITCGCTIRSIEMVPVRAPDSPKRDADIDAFRRGTAELADRAKCEECEADDGAKLDNLLNLFKFLDAINDA